MAGISIKSHLHRYLNRKFTNTKAILQVMGMGGTINASTVVGFEAFIARFAFIWLIALFAIFRAFY